MKNLIKAILYYIGGLSVLFGILFVVDYLESHPLHITQSASMILVCTAISIYFGRVFCTETTVKIGILAFIILETIFLLADYIIFFAPLLVLMYIGNMLLVASFVILPIYLIKFNLDLKNNKPKL